MDKIQLHLNDEMIKNIELIVNMIFVTFNEKDFNYIINLIKDYLDVYNCDSDSDSNVWTESDESQEDELTYDEIEYLRNININQF